MAQLQVKLQVLPDGQPLLPSAAKLADGKPRFYLPLIKELADNDIGIRYLVIQESFYDGYESTSRTFFDEHLQPGDVFIDVGAHWGVYTLSAATRWPGQIDVLAVEPHPLNVVQLLKSVAFNELAGVVEVVAAAAGAKSYTALLHADSTMGHSLDESIALDRQFRLRVPVVTLDELIAARPDLGQRRMFLKIDVEGLEYEVLLGARRLLESGRVAAVLWEKGTSYGSEPGRGKMLRLVDELRRLGFTSHRFPSIEFGGPLLPFAPTPEVGNVFSLAPGFSRRPSYPQSFESRPPFRLLFANPDDAAARAQTTVQLQEVEGSDGARWADPAELQNGAEPRALAAARYLLAGHRVLDLGAGARALERHLISGCSYMAADLIARSAECQVVDLNQGQFPTGEFDVVALLEVLEYIHDVPALLRRGLAAAARMICSYNPRRGESIALRRQQGWFNDFTLDEINGLLTQCGWKISDQITQGTCEIFCCVPRAQMSMSGRAK